MIPPILPIKVSSYFERIKGSRDDWSRDYLMVMQTASGKEEQEERKKMKMKQVQLQCSDCQNKTNRTCLERMKVSVLGGGKLNLDL